MPVSIVRPPMVKRAQPCRSCPSLAAYEAQDKMDGVPQIHARVSVLEDAVSNLHNDLSKVEQAMLSGFQDIQNVLRSSSKTNWGTVISGGMLLLALWAAAIYPLSKDTERLRESDIAQMTAISELGTQHGDMRVKQEINIARIDALNQVVRDLQVYGSPTSDRRLAVIEARMGIASSAVTVTH